MQLLRTSFFVLRNQGFQAYFQKFSLKFGAVFPSESSHARIKREMLKFDKKIFKKVLKYIFMCVKLLLLFIIA